jgi:DNA polymerase-4
LAGPRTILHLDLDAFYASVEQLDDPSLRGRPVVVGGTSRRGVVCAASYEARKFGVRSAMPTARAHRLCPDAVFLPPRFDRYTALSSQVFGIYRNYTPLVEPLSLDEAFLDVTASRMLRGTGRDIAAAIKREVRSQTGLAVSAGIAEVKLAAKIATDLGKPDGLVEVPLGGVRAFLAPLPVGRLWGVGEVTEAALRKIGVATIGDLTRLPENAVAAAIGPNAAHHLRSLALGDDPRDVVPDEAAKSVGSEETFEEDVRDTKVLERSLLEHALRVGRRLRAHGQAGPVVTLKITYSDFTQVTRRVTLPEPTDDDRAIFEAARAQLARIEPGRPVRLAGVSVSGFEGRAPKAQLDLFGGAAAPPGAEPASPAADPRRKKLNAALDALAEKFGENAVRPADLDDRPKGVGQGRVRKPRGTPED